MENKKLFYKVGDLLEIRSLICQTQQYYKDKLCLVVRSFYKNKKPMYQVKIINYDPKPNPHGCFYQPFEIINNDPSHIIIGQYHLRRRRA